MVLDRSASAIARSGYGVSENRKSRERAEDPSSLNADDAAELKRVFGLHRGLVHQWTSIDVVYRGR